MARISSYDYNRYINYCFVGLAFSIPISKALTSIFTGLMILLWLFEGDFKKKFKMIGSNGLSMAILLLIAFSIVAILWSSNTQYAVKFIRVKYWYFAPVIIMLTSFNMKYVKYVLDGFLASMFISEIISYGIYFRLWHFNGTTHVFPTAFMDHVSYSVYLAFAIMILAVKIFEQKSLITQIPLSIFFLTATTNLFVNGGRTGQFAFVGTLLLIALMYYRKSYKILISSILIASLSIPLAYAYSPNFHNRIDQLYKDLHNAYAYHNFKGSVATRISLWTIGIDKFINHPVLGSGIGNEMKNIDPYIKKFGFNEKYLKTFSDYNNNFIEYAVELGTFGLLLNLYIFYCLFTFKIKEKRYKILSIAFSTIFLSDALGGFSFHIMNPLTLFAVFAALFNAIAQREKDNFAN